MGSAAIVVQVKVDRVMRVFAVREQAINESWLFRKESLLVRGAEFRRALNSFADDQARRRVENGRLADGARVRPRAGLSEVVAKHGASALGTLVSPHSTLEELRSPRA
jgi:NADH-quinone oxidoreductase subunit G